MHTKTHLIVLGSLYRAQYTKSSYYTLVITFSLVCMFISLTLFYRYISKKANISNAFCNSILSNSNCSLKNYPFSLSNTY